MEVMQPINKKEATKNWSGYEMSPEIIESLIANNFIKPTDV